MNMQVSQRGFTLVESVVVIAICAIVLNAAVSGFAGFIERNRLKSTAALISTELQYLRSEAVVRNENRWLAFAVDAGGACYVMHSGPKDGCRCQPGNTTQCKTEAVEIRTVQWPAADGIQLERVPRVFSFDERLGTATPGATIRLRSTSGHQLNVVVNSMGRVKQCAPGRPMTGYARC